MLLRADWVPNQVMSQDLRQHEEIFKSRSNDLPTNHQPGGDMPGHKKSKYMSKGGSRKKRR